MGLLAGLCYGLSNTIFAQGCTSLGFWGGGFQGPMILFMAAMYRLVESIIIKTRSGSFIDRVNSNYWILVEENDDYKTINGPPQSQKQYRFNWKNFLIMALTQSLTQFLSVFLVLYAFKFALMADMNQGCVPSIFAVNGIYTAIVFYFSFGEKISISKIIGIFFVALCIILLTFDKKYKDQGKQGYTA